ncbi:MAG: hypothetical protein NDI95_05115, partial [Acidovorax soli]|uniref:hypothetical protein n=1 Tax=Acidovorax soli TaxID=592050 RepID=UPI0026F1F267
MASLPLAFFVRVLRVEEKRRWFWVLLGKNPVYNSRLRSVDLVAASGWVWKVKVFESLTVLQKLC